MKGEILLQGLHDEESPLPTWEACQRVKKAQSPGQMPEALRVLVKGHLEGGTMWYWMCSALGPKPFMPSETSPCQSWLPPGVWFGGHSWKQTIHWIGWTLPGTARPRNAFLVTASNDEEAGVPLPRKPRTELLDLCLPLRSARVPRHLHSRTVLLLLLFLFMCKWRNPVLKPSTLHRARDLGEEALSG